MPTRRATLPPCPKRASIILYGGSFNPPHAGHVQVSDIALRYLQADYLWWLVTPQNPLKAKKPLPLTKRLALCRQLIRHKRMFACAPEADWGYRHSIDTVRTLKRRYPQTRFLWLMGADSLARLHHWKAWQKFFTEIPLAIYPRASETGRAGLSPAARCFRNARQTSYRGRHIKMLQYAMPPAWAMLSARLNPLTSSDLPPNRTTMPRSLFV